MASRLGMNGADRRMETRDQNESGSFHEKIIGPKSYSYAELAKVTGHFSLNNLIGRGGFGHVFKASLDGEIRAIKRLDFPDVQSEGGLEREIMVVKSVSHKNLVELVGYCIDGANRLLILKYFPNGSLRSKLHGSGDVLDWEKRMKIATGSAKGLEYLHEHCKPKIIHLDVKPDNILLDEDFEPKITDFGLAQFFTDGGTHISKSSVMGTHVYEDPLTTKLGKYSDKSDIYSFGVTLLELITGRKPINNSTDIVTWANHLIKKALEGRYTNFVDSNLQSFDHEQMYRMVSCVNSCINQPPNSRPTMEKIRLVLEGKSPPEELYDHKLQWSIIHRDDESSSYFEEIDQIEESGSLHDKNYKGGLKPYSYSELAKATDQFSLERQFGQGGFGQAFIASLDGKIRVVKKLKNFPDVQSERDFEREIMVLNGVRHKNLVKLVGYCIEGANRLLISKFFPNMSLRYQLDRKENVLDWKKRMNIAIGSARGLECLHEDRRLKIIHLHIKSDNILLDNYFNPKAQPLMKKALEGEYTDFIDSRLQFFDDQEMHRMIFCANVCINQPLRSRPSMKMILLALEGIIPLDSLARDE
ncbi:hypothetical protein MANES_11G041750v8 [Manihot esculenta]|uniref:Uncharacterized protein n=1 Tax=Manihot esculenta TaxID=3983 RepID=A0ACB7GTG4_MANES|nr:hypothetical protein MANES_11G041750v8 [Manihot esculenta]